MLTSDGCIYGTPRYTAKNKLGHVLPLAGDTHPAPPFLLAQSLSPKVSAGREDNLI